MFPQKHKRYLKMSKNMTNPKSFIYNERHILSLPKSRSTLAIIFILCIDTLVTASIHRNISALIHIAVQRLVAVVAAVIHLRLG